MTGNPNESGGLIQAWELAAFLVNVAPVPKAFRLYLIHGLLVNAASAPRTCQPCSTTRLRTAYIHRSLKPAACSGDAKTTTLYVLRGLELLQDPDLCARPIGSNGYKVAASYPPALVRVVLADGSLFQDAYVTLPRPGTHSHRSHDVVMGWLCRVPLKPNFTARDTLAQLMRTAGLPTAGPGAVLEWGLFERTTMDDDCTMVSIARVRNTHALSG